jgi:hypothetical protein
MRRSYSAPLVWLIAIGIAVGCGFDDSLREYLDKRFWLPFAKTGRHFERRGVKRVSLPYAGMAKAEGGSPLAKLRKAYQDIREPVDVAYDPSREKQVVAAARADKTLSVRDREEVDLIDAKIDMRAGQPEEPERLREAQKKLEQFLKTARTPAFRSEARGWLAHIHYLMGEQTEAGKIYIDELNRDGSNLSRETLLTSLKMNYGYTGGGELRAHLADYFDTPEHAAFAIEIATNPHWDRESRHGTMGQTRSSRDSRAYEEIRDLLQKHTDLLKSQRGAYALALLSMRTALAMGDPEEALKIADAVAASDPIRSEPDFLWMWASGHYLSHDYAGAEGPLLDLFESRRASRDEKAAAAYALCGVYQKANNPVEQIRFALWLRPRENGGREYWSMPSDNDDLSIYWAPSGFDLSLLLDQEAPVDAIEAFLAKYPDATNIRLVKYSLAVRLTRENRYDDAARIYESIGQARRGPRMRQLAKLYDAAKKSHEDQYRLAEFLTQHENGIYYNDAMWGGLQRYALIAEDDSRLTRKERDRMALGERKLKDEQNERWQAYLILRDVAEAEAKTELGQKAARLAIKCVRGFSDRFGREEDLRKADIEMSKLLR